MDRTAGVCWSLLLNGQVAHIFHGGDLSQPVFLYELLVYSSPFAEIYGCRGYAKRRGFAIHCAAGANDQIAMRD